MSVLIRIREEDILHSERPLEHVQRLSEYHLLEGEFELTAESTRTKYTIEARFPSEENALEFLTVLFHGDEKQAWDFWRAQP